MTDTNTAGLMIEPLALEATNEVFEASRKRSQELKDRRVLIEIEGRDLHLVQGLLIAITEDRGCTTPVERFVTDAVKEYVNYQGAIGPECVDQLAASFKDDFEDAIFMARTALRRYPERLTETKPEAA